MVLAVIFALPWFFAGMGVSSRRPWGRIMTFVMCGFAILGSLGSLLAMGLLSSEIIGYRWDRLAESPYGQSVIKAFLMHLATATALFIYAGYNLWVHTQQRFVKEFQPKRPTN
ncbi:MAG TPA: hypothetical protein VL096_05040, partial [Pirellulaceae bacterium]|nr:hypothetical protein [Pirellulaceae bacterium]